MAKPEGCAGTDGPGAKTAPCSNTAVQRIASDVAATRGFFDPKTFVDDSCLPTLRQSADMFQHSELQSLFNTFVSPLRIPQKSWISARSSWIKNAYGDSHVEHAGIEMATLGNQKKWSIASEVEICVKTRCVLPDPVVLKRGAGRW